MWREIVARGAHLEKKQFQRRLSTDVGWKAVINEDVVGCGEVSWMKGWEGSAVVTQLQ